MRRPPSRRPSRRRLLGIGKWTGLCLCVAIAGVWLASPRLYLGWTRKRREVWIAAITYGRVELLRRCSPASQRGPWLGTIGWQFGAGEHFTCSRGKRLHWDHNFTFGVVRANPGRPLYILTVPLWAPFLLAAAPTALMWWRSRRPKPEHCRCGYSLDGLHGKVCPECGGDAGEAEGRVDMIVGD